MDVWFGPYRLLATRRLLLEGNQPVRLGSRAFDILTALVERAGEVVGKDELIARAWPATFVDEANLKIQVSALRRALGDGQGGNRYVATIIGRGYNFVAPIREAEPSWTLPSPTAASATPHNLPFATTRMIGREEIVTGLVAQLSRRRLVTVLGPGGIGKSTVALAVAERMIGAYEHGVWLVDLASLSGPHLVSSAVATVLGVEVRVEDPLLSLAAALRDRRILLLLDNCEHVVAAAADLAATALRGASGVTVLATSREPLSVPGERVVRLGSLGSPEPSAGLTASEAAAFPSVQLFVERVTALIEDFALTDANAPLVAAICRRLDGLPLAIEFVAPRVEAFGIEGLAACLDDRLRLLGSRRRWALPRHRTMRAVIDWSYELLSPREQRDFRALGIFNGGFDGEAATSVITEEVTTDVDALDRLASLIAKSLVVTNVSGARPRFRLLDTTRAHALELLVTSGESASIARRHAKYYRLVLAQAEAEAPLRATGDWLAEYTPELDNVRAALEWAFSSVGDVSTGIALTASAFPLWTRLSLLEECRRHTRQALAALETASIEAPREAMRLHAALGASTPEASEMEAAFVKSLNIARHLGDYEYQLRALRGLYYYHTGSGRFGAALPYAREFHALTLRGLDQSDLMFGERMMGSAEHFVGNQSGARHHLEGVLAHTVSDPGPDVNRFQDFVRFGTDLRVSAQAFLARVLWLQGFADQATRAAKESLDEAEATGNPITQCHVLALATCTVSFWTGDRVAAARYVATLVDLSRQHALPHWGAFGARFEQIVDIRTRVHDGRSRRPPSGQSTAANPNFSFRSLVELTQLTEALGQAGRSAEGLALLEAGSKQFDASCFTPELSRLRGELSRMQGRPDAEVSAEADFRHALRVSRKHGSLSWELRTATSCARLMLSQGRYADAISCLQPIYDRFTEGFGTADLIAAKQLLDDLGGIEHR